jgi:conjugative transfer region protein TrbK
MRGGLLKIRAIARAVGLALVAVAMAMVATTIDLGRHEPLPQLPRTVIAPQADPLMHELSRCEALGTAAEQDPSCEAIWAEIQRRLFIDSPADNGSRNAQTPNQAAPKPEDR